VVCKNRALFLVNPKTDLCLKTYEGAHAREVRDASSSRDNSKLASVGGDKGVFVWDVKTGQTVRRFIGHDAFGVNCVKFLLGHSNEESVIVVVRVRSVREVLGFTVEQATRGDGDGWIPV
jgi:mitogen-activated protein kinase organizer 1